MHAVQTLFSLVCLLMLQWHDLWPVVCLTACPCQVADDAICCNINLPAVFTMQATVTSAVADVTCNVVADVTC